MPPTPEATMITSFPHQSHQTQATPTPSYCHQHSLSSLTTDDEEYYTKMNQLAKQQVVTSPHLSVSERTTLISNTGNNDNHKKLSNSYSEASNHYYCNTTLKPPQECKRNTICNGADRHQLQLKQEQQDQLLANPLHKTLYDNFHTELSSLREATIDALQVSNTQHENLCYDIEVMSSRISYLRKKISLTGNEYLKKHGGENGMLLEGNDELTDELRKSLRMSMVLEADTEEADSTDNVSGLEGGGGGGMDGDNNSDIDGDEKNIQLLSNSTIQRIGQSHNEINASLTSSSKHTHRSSTNTRRSSMRSSLHGSNISDATGMPHMSRSSLLNMLGTSKAWLEQHDPAQSNNNEHSRHSISSNEKDSTTEDPSPRPSFRFSFMMGDGGGDGMPSRWRAREKERAKTEKQKEEEEKRQQEQAIKDKRGESNEVKLQSLISKREIEISKLEKRTELVVQQTSTLRDEVHTLEAAQRTSLNEYEHNRTHLINELHQVESDNERLNHMLVDTGVTLEEKKMCVDILASELKEARDELAYIQKERDRIRKKKKSLIMNRKSNGGSKEQQIQQKNSQKKKEKKPQRRCKEEKEGEQKPGESPQQGSYHQKRRSSLGSSQGKLTGYQNIPEDVIPCSSKDDDTISSCSKEDLDDVEDEEGNDNSRSRSSSCISAMSALTVDSCEMVDILELLKLED